MTSKTINTYIYLKKCWTESNSDIGIPLAIYDKAMLLVIFLKLTNNLNWYVLGLTIIVFTVFMIIFGHWKLKYRMTEKEMSLSNKYNPEIQQILLELKGKK